MSAMPRVKRVTTKAIAGRPKVRRKRGDIREDGRVFRGYTRQTLADGSVKEYECWVTPASLKRHKTAIVKWAERNKAHKRAYASKYYAANKRRIRETHAKWQAANREKHRASNEKYREKNRNLINTKQAARYVENQEKISAYHAKRYRKDRAKILARCAKYRIENPEKRSKTVAKYTAENKEKIRDFQRKYNTRRYAKDIEFRIQKILRARLLAALKGRSKTASATTLIGCSIARLKQHLEQMFDSRMTWENYGHRTWHIDHIIPLAAFDLTKPAQQRKAFHWKNLQPLWAVENLKKGARGFTKPARRNVAKVRR
jgi:hypothetical protein